MNDEEPRRKLEPHAEPRKPESAAESKPALLLLPGLAAIALYLLLLAIVIVIGVVESKYPRAFIVLPVFLFASAGGLMMLFRWAWSLALAAVLLLSCYNLWIFTRLHAGVALIQGLLNLVFFFYLVRTEVREKLR